MYKRFAVLMALVVVAALAGGCMTSKMGVNAAEMGPPMSAANDMTAVRSDRMLIWNASLSLDVADVTEAAAEAARIVEASGGYVERKRDTDDDSASLDLRVPADAFKSTVGSLEALGKVTYRSVSAEDVTEEYVDVEARLKNKKALRDRLTELLDKAVDVEDILALETELNRVQSDIDSMEARIKSLKGQVDLATIHLSLDRKRILGPVGYLLKGVWWGFEKLFVIRD